MMNKILNLTLLICIIGFSQNVEEIIAKIENNQAKIKDLTAEVEIETSIQGKAEPLIQTMKIWQSKDETGNPITRTEFEMPEARGQKQEKVIMIMTNDSVITKKGKTVSRLPLTAQMGAERKQSQMNADMFKEAKSVKILQADGNIVVLELIPKETEGIKLFDKAEITVDTERGVITSQKVFTPMGMIRSEMKYWSIGEGEKRIWVLKEMKTITQYGITVMRYKNIKLNKGIKKEKFEL